MRAIIRGIGALLLIALVPARAPAQSQADLPGAISDVFKRVKGIAIYGRTGGLTKAQDLTTSEFILPAPSGMRGFGLELLIHLTTEQPDEAWSYELGFGYDYTVGYRSSVPGLEVATAVRARPRVTGYATSPWHWWGFEPYFGLGFGAVDLWNGKGFDASGNGYALGGDTYEFGFSWGLFREPGWFLEAEYRDRRFTTINWTPAGAAPPAPATWPRALNVSEVSLSVGFQFGGPEEAKE